MQSLTHFPGGIMVDPCHYLGETDAFWIIWYGEGGADYTLVEDSAHHGFGCANQGGGQDVGIPIWGY